MNESRATFACVFAALSLFSGGAQAQAVTEFHTGITGSAQPWGITAGPDGNLWFAESAGDRIGRITPTGTITEFTTGVTAGSHPTSITVGPDHNLWFTEQNGSRIGQITTAGVVTEFTAGISGSATDITAGPDGNLWFTEAAGRIGKITIAGVVTEYTAGITAGAVPLGIAAGADGNLWFTENNGNRIGRITTGGSVTEFSAGITANASIQYITAGPDGNLWFTEFNLNRIGRITPSGVVTEFVGLTGTEPYGIAAGPDGNLWFTEFSSQIGRMTPGGIVTEFSAGISAFSGPLGITAGPDGNLWFAEWFGNRIGRLTTPPPALMGAVSRKVHGAAGTFDLPLSMVATNPTTEPRQSTTATIVMTFDSPVVSANAAITEGTATAGAPTFSGNDVTVALTGVADQQYVTVSLTNVASASTTGGTASIRLGLLRGDVNQTRVVTVADLGLVNAQLAQPVTAANYLKDVSASGTLTVADKGITNANLTKSLPAP